MTKKQESMYQNYIRATARTLGDVYKTWSWAKFRAYDYCMNLCAKLNGKNPKICSANTFSFTFAFTFEKEGKQWLRYETSSNSYEFCIE